MTKPVFYYSYNYVGGTKKPDIVRLNGAAISHQGKDILFIFRTSKH